MARTFKTQEQLTQERQEQLGFMQIRLPLDKLLVAYGRQSTAKQVVNNKESAQQQAIDLLDYALELGWPDDKRLLFIENQLADGTIRNASGRLRIDERPGLQEVTRLIETGEVGAVLVRSIDRLFRDDTMVGPVVFADICKKYYVIILTPDDLYDFNNSRRDDLNRFIMEAMKAKDYIEKHVKGVMLRMRVRKAMRGEYAGNAVPTGFMLDDERRHYVPNPYFAPVMARLLRRYRELDGNFAELRREVVGKPIFPDLPEEILKRIGRISLTKIPGGYTVKSHQGLVYLMTNVALIGHVAYDGRIVKKNAHPAIVNEADFWFAFERLSPTDIDGIPINKPTRVNRNNSASYPALLQGVRANGEAVLTSKNGYVYVMPHGQNHTYVYIIRDMRRIAVNQDVTCIRVQDLDAIVVNHLLERLDGFRIAHNAAQNAHQNKDAFISPSLIDIFCAYTRYEADKQRGKLGQEAPYYQLLAMQQEQSTSLVSIPESIEEAKQKLARLQRDYKVNFDLMTDKELRENRLARLRLAKDIAEMEQKQEEAAATEEDKRDVDLLLQDAYGVWPKLTLEKQRRFMRRATNSIGLHVLTDGWLLLIIDWSPYVSIAEADIAFIWRQRGAGKVWTPEELDILKTHYSTASRGWLLEQLPTRSWTSIRAKAMRDNLSRHTQFNDTDLLDWISVEDKRVLDTYNLTLEDPSQRVWWGIVTKSMSEGLSSCV